MWGRDTESSALLHLELLLSEAGNFSSIPDVGIGEVKFTGVITLDGKDVVLPPSNDPPPVIPQDQSMGSNGVMVSTLTSGFG